MTLQSERAAPESKSELFRELVDLLKAHYDNPVVSFLSAGSSAIRMRVMEDGGALTYYRVTVVKEI